MVILPKYMSLSDAYRIGPALARAGTSARLHLILEGASSTTLSILELFVPFARFFRRRDKRRPTRQEHLDTLAERLRTNFAAEIVFDADGTRRWDPFLKTGPPGVPVGGRSFVFDSRSVCSVRIPQVVRKMGPPHRKQPPGVDPPPPRPTPPTAPTRSGYADRAVGWLRPTMCAASRLSRPSNTSGRRSRRWSWGGWGRRSRRWGHRR
jgi:hypothetical protein